MHYSDVGEGFAAVLNIAHWITTICADLGFGIITFEPPKGMWPNGTTPVSPAAQRVKIFACQLFCVSSGIQIAKTVEEFLSFKLKALNDGTDAAAM